MPSVSTQEINRIQIIQSFEYTIKIRRPTAYWVGTPFFESETRTGQTDRRTDGRARPCEDNASSQSYRICEPLCVPVFGVVLHAHHNSNLV